MSALQQWANNASSTLYAAITESSTNLQVNTGDGALFPALTGSRFFMATLCNVTSGVETQIEIVKVTDRAGDVFTIVRAQEGTTANIYAALAKVSLRATAGFMSSLVTLDDSQMLTNKTLTSPQVNQVLDTNGNVITVMNPVASAVNQVTQSNAATGTAPSIAATGTDTNISLNLVSKGTGTVQANGVQVADISSAQIWTNKTLTSPGLNQPLLAYSYSTGVSAAGTTQGTATAVTTDFINVTTCAAGAGIILPVTVAGREITIKNNGANALLVYPASGGVIDSNATNAAYSIPPGATEGFSYTSTINVQTMEGRQTSSNVALSVVQRDASGNFSAGTITANALNLAGTTSPLNLAGSAGLSGQVLTSSGPGATPVWSSIAVSSMVYPGAGIPNSTGTTWGTSYGVTGSGNVVLSTSPTLVSPAIGTPASGNLQNTTAPTQPWTGAVSRPLLSTLGDWVSVKNFGAVGDGTTDDTAAIQAAITHAGTLAYGANVFFPDGEYKVTSTLTISGNSVSLTGASRDSVQIIRSTAYGEIFAFSKGTSTVLDGVGIFNMRLIDNGTNNATGTAIRVENVSRFELNNIIIFGGTNGVIFKGAANVVVNNLTMYMQNASGSPTGRYGIQITNTAIGSAAVVFGSNMQFSNVSIYGGDQVSATYSNLDDCIRVECVDGLWLNNVYAGGAAIADLHIYRTNASYTCGDIFSTNMMLDICRGNGLLIDGTQYVTKSIFQGDISCNGAGVASKDGVYISGPVDSILFTGSVLGWKGNGIYIAASGGTGCTNVTISGMNIVANTGYGIEIATNSGTNYLTIVGNNTALNTGGSINDGTDVNSTTKTIESNLGYSAPWVSYTPTLSAAGGAISGTATGSYKKVGNIVNFRAKVTSIVSDTGTGYLIVSLPGSAGAVAGDTFAITANEATTNHACTARAIVGTATCYILNYDGSYPSAVGRTFYINGTYQV